MQPIKVNQEISLVPINESFLDDIFNNFSLQVVKYLPLLEPSKDIKNTQSFIQGAVLKNENQTDLIWVVLKNNKFIGCCGVRDINTRQGDFGYWLKTSEQGKGIGKIVAKTVFNWSFKTLDLDLIKYPVDKDNIASVKIIKSIGGKLAKQYIAGEENCLNIHEYHVLKKGINT